MIYNKISNVNASNSESTENESIFDGKLFKLIKFDNINNEIEDVKSDEISSGNIKISFVAPTYIARQGFHKLLYKDLA